MVKVRQERRDRKTTGLRIHGEVRQGLFLNRPWTRKGGGMVNWYVAALWKAGCGETRTSGLEGGKAAKPDLPYHLIAFIAIAFISILSRRMRRLVVEECSA
jgi:hypothetical protein